jgi:general secretion pathway protein G
MKKNKNSKIKIQNFHKGFTLIELLIVIAIIGVLATLLMVNFVGVRQRARDAQRKSDLRQLQSALEIYRSDNSSYPVSGTTGSSSNTLVANCSGSLGNGPGCTTIYIKTISTDPSGSSYYNGGYYYYSSDGTSGNYTLGTCLENSGDSQGTPTNPGGTGTCASGKYYVLNNP